MPTVMQVNEAIEDGMGGAFVLEVHRKRTAITHRDSRDRVHPIAVTYGPNSGDLARVLVEALVGQLRRRSATGDLKGRCRRAISSDSSDSR